MKISRITYIIFLLGFFLSPSTNFAQPINLENADQLLSGNEFGPDVQRLIGNVIMEQKEVTLYSDSAHVYRKENKFVGFGNVHVKRGENLHIFGEELQYSGDEKIGHIRQNVRLEDGRIILLTNDLDFNLEDNSGHFYNEGTLIDSSITLSSSQGWYFPDEEKYIFQDTVVVFNEKFIMYTDSLVYFREKEKAFFYGDTDIETDSTDIHCLKGWYDLDKDIARFTKDAYIIRENQYLAGDSLMYDRANGIGEARRNISLIDSTENTKITGHYAIYNQKTEFSLVTDSALMMYYSDTDTLYLHADTLISQLDTSGNHKEVKAYYKAQIFKSDMQARSDSMHYSLRDSVIRLYDNPVVWSEENQITAQYIELHTEQNKPKTAFMKNGAMIVSQEDSIHFTQVVGAGMIGHFTENQLKQIDVEENARSIYYPKDQELIIGVNKTESQKMIIYMDDKSIQKIAFLNQAKASLYPLEKLSLQEQKFENFQWLEHLRPKNKYDVFVWKKRE